MMKIGIDPITSLDQEQSQVRRPEAAEGFDALLSQEVQAQGTAQAEGSVLRPPPAPLLPHQVAAAQATQGEDQPTAGRDVMEQLENILGEWENYAAHLSEPATGSGLREADGTLSGIEGDVAKLKSDWPKLGQDNPGLKSVVDELEIMTVTERIKLNRGDYLS
jgi:hypothetical protein